MFGEGVLLVKEKTQAKVGPGRVNRSLTVIHCNVLHILNESSSHAFYKPLWNWASFAGQIPHPRGEESGQMPIPSLFLTRQKFFGVLIGLDD